MMLLRHLSDSGAGQTHAFIDDILAVNSRGNRLEFNYWAELPAFTLQIARLNSGSRTI